MDPLPDLRAQYFALVPPRLIRLPPASSAASAAVQRYLLTHPLDESRWPQPEDGYRRNFWRLMLRQLEVGLEELHVAGNDTAEDCEVEIDERFYELVSGLMVDSTPIATEAPEPRQSHRTFIYRHPPDPGASGQTHQQSESQRHFTLLEEQTVLQGGTTGLRTWTAALHLGHHLLHSPTSLLPDLTASGSGSVLELGAGTGFLSCLLAQQGFRVTATDLGESAAGRLTPLSRLQHNICLNGLQDRVRVQALDWTDAEKDVDRRPEIWRQKCAEPPDVIVAADVIYDPDLISPLVITLRTLLSATKPSHGKGRYAIIAATVRNPDTLDIFSQCCARSALDVTKLDGLPVIDPAAPTFWDSGLDVSVPVQIMRITLGVAP